MKLRLTFLCGIFLLTSCSTYSHLYQQSEQAAKRTEHEIHATEQFVNRTPPAVITSADYYVDKTPVTKHQKAAWLDKKITVRAKQMPFAALTSHILRETNTTINYENDVQQNLAVSMRYTGTIQGALNELATRTHYDYEIVNDQVNWSDLMTKTFNIAFMPGNISYAVGQTSASSKATTQVQGNVATMHGSLDDKQYSGLSGNISVWKDLENTLNNLKSKDGKIYVSQSTTSVTVHDHAKNVWTMAKYIKQLNHDMSQQVQLKVRVLELELDKSHKYGVNWDVVQHMLGTSFSLSGSLATAASVGTITAGDRVITGTTPATMRIGDSSGSNALVQALSQQGKLSIVTEPNVATMNNQVAEININRNTSYLQSISHTLSGTDNDQTTTTLNPGIVTDGFTLYLLPKIQDNEVYLQISSTLSTLTEVDKISSPITENTTTSQQQSASIEVPTLAEKRFNLRSKVRSGSSLIIAGFKQLKDQTKKSKMFGSETLGGQGSQSKNVETILLITPTIIENQA